ncbi:MAG: carboxylesterase family protein [Ruminococcus sp.]|nr:carboxylesterase family protein [Ruminococcus sp.]
MSTSVAEIRASYGENRIISGDFDESLSVKCSCGTFVGKRSGDVLSFCGVPYAKPPIGELRWKRPRPIEFSDAVYEALYNGKTPVQTEIDSERASFYPQGEDCLYLNIWTNTACADKDKTVMVFFHGGSYGWGGTADPLYNGEAFVKTNPDVILVTVGYRVGLLGFVDFSEVKGGDEFPDSSNLGILDQIESLRWVKNNIGAFGGNPDNVTIFGESAGGGSVSLLPIIDEAKGLFRRVIAQSGSVALTFSKKECAGYTRKLFKGSGAKDMSDLMKLSEDEIIELNKRLNLDNNFPQRDGKLIPLNPYEAYSSGKTADVDFLIGTNKNELNYWIGELGGIVPFRFGIPVKFENDIKNLSKTDKRRISKFMSGLKGHSMWKIAEFYNEVMFRLPALNQAELHNKNGGKVFMYYFTEPSAIKYRGACHAVELAYVFGNTNETIYTGSPANKKLSHAVMNMWANFARCGNPSIDKLTWERYDTATRATMMISKRPHIQYDILKKHRKLLNPLIRHMINASYTELDFNVPFVYKSAAKVFGVAAFTAAAALIIRKIVKD